METLIKLLTNKIRRLSIWTRQYKDGSVDKNQLAELTRDIMDNLRELMFEIETE